jgi:hypothetical protein
VSLTNGVVAALLVVVLAAIALVAKPPAPPGISEFAPQATKPIAKAPLGQTGEAGSGRGSCSAGTPCGARPTVSARPLAGRPVARPTDRLGVPSALQCYEWPDGSVTQTFDPQSPPCVASWPGAVDGNGGSTSKGVTPNTVTVSVGSSLDPGNPTTAIAKAFVEFLNRHFQLYGRKIVLASHAVDGTYGDPSSQRAAAAKAAQAGAFSAIYTDNSANDDSLFLDNLARKGVIGVNAWTTYVTSAQLEALAPYGWSYHPTFDDEQRNAGTFVCRALAHHPASYAGDPGLRVQTRSFAILYPKPNSGPRPDLQPLRDTLASCGVSAGSIEYVGFPGGSDATDTTNSQVLLDLKQRGISTLMTVGSTLDIPDVMTAASTDSYHPEWFSVTTGDYYSWQYTQVPADETAGLMGIAYWNKSLPHSTSIPFRAFDEVDHGRTDPRAFSNQDDSLYKALLLIASGIQAAGPNLSPASFARGLASLKFPNPERGGAPHFQARVSLRSDRAMVDDYGLWFWRQSEPNHDGAVQNANGNYCYVERGNRFHLGTWPNKDPGFFSATSPC